MFEWIKRKLRKLLGIRSPSEEFLASLNANHHNPDRCDTCRSLAEIQRWLTSEYQAMIDDYIREAEREQAKDQEEKLPEAAEERDGTTAQGGLTET